MDERIVKICKFLNVDVERAHLLSDDDRRAMLKAWDEDDLAGVSHIGWKLVNPEDKYKKLCDEKEKGAPDEPKIVFGSAFVLEDGGTIRPATYKDFYHIDDECPEVPIEDISMEEVRAGIRDDECPEAPELNSEAFWDSEATDKVPFSDYEEHETFRKHMFPNASSVDKMADRFANQCLQKYPLAIGLVKKQQAAKTK